MACTQSHKQSERTPRRAAGVASVLCGASAGLASSRWVWSCLVSAIGIALLSTSGAGAVSFEMEFRTTGYHVQQSDTFADLEYQHGLGTHIQSASLTALEDVSARTIANVNGNYSLLMTTVIDVATAGDYVFQVGTDWGWGGGSIVIDNGTGQVLDEYVNPNDLWWNNNWSDPDVFTMAVTLAAGGSYTLKWVGFEGCCGGPTTVRFSVDGSGFQTLDETNLSTFISNVPEPTTALLVGAGLGWLAIARRRTPRSAR